MVRGSRGHSARPAARPPATVSEVRRANHGDAITLAAPSRWTANDRRASKRSQAGTTWLASSWTYLPIFQRGHETWTRFAPVSRSASSVGRSNTSIRRSARIAGLVTNRA